MHPVDRQKLDMGTQVPVNLAAALHEANFAAEQHFFYFHP
jgi:hypothetical protein